MNFTLDTSHFERSPLNFDAALNMDFIPPLDFTPDTSHFERSPLNNDADWNIVFMFFALDTSHFERSPLNDDDLLNMARMNFTLDTSHFERSPLNLFAPGIGCLVLLTNNQLMSGTAETSQDPIGPCGPLEQSKSERF